MDSISNFSIYSPHPTAHDSEKNCPANLCHQSQLVLDFLFANIKMFYFQLITLVSCLRILRMIHDIMIRYIYIETDFLMKNNRRLISIVSVENLDYSK